MNDYRNGPWPDQEPDRHRPGQRPPDGRPAWPTGQDSQGRQPGWPRGEQQRGGQGGPGWPSARSGGGPQGPPRGQGPYGARPPGAQPPGGQRPPADRRQGQPYGGQRPGANPQGGHGPQGQQGYRGNPQREPNLLTHDHYGVGAQQDQRQGFVQPGDWDDDEQRRFDQLGDDEESAAGTEGSKKKKVDKASLTPKQRKKRRWRRVRRTLYAFVGIFFVLPALAFTIAYFLVDVPSPDEVAAGQNKTVTYYYADGSEMGKDVPPGGNRVLLDPGQVPDIVKHAAYAAEDATFESNSGFDVLGIVRAAWNQVSGGSGGGSTISQQYIKKATENEDHTITRKALELVKSFKMNNEQSKDDIITAYLNTIYFGRGANGIQTAAQAYFKKDVGQLNASEAALLAGMIQAPGRADDQEYAQQRWTYVMDQMAANHWISPEERASAQFPSPLPSEETKPQSITGPASLVQDRVKAELEAQGYPEEKIFAGGYKVYTTIDPKAQQIAESTVNDVMKGQPEELKDALVAVDPKNGAVKAYYGGPADKSDQRDWANTPRPPGSSFKAFDLVALLQKGRGLGQTYDGTSPRDIQGATVRNADDTQCPNCTVGEATEKSINTVFYDLVANTTGVKPVVDAAHAAGVTAEMPNPDANISIGGGEGVQVTPSDMAGAYATFAAQGTRHPEHFVSKVTTADDQSVLEKGDEGSPAFAPNDPNKNKQIAGNVTTALETVPPYSKLSCAGGRDCAGKTGTHQYVDPSGKQVDENAQAWMVGYTPSLSTSAWVGTGANEKIRDKNGKRIYGKDLPGEMWKNFMDAYLKGTKNERFPKVQPIGKPYTGNESKPSKPKRTPTPSRPSLPPTTLPRPTPETSEPAEPDSSEPQTPSEEPSSPSEPPTSDEPDIPDIPGDGEGGRSSGPDE